MNLNNKTILITGGSSGIGLQAIPYFLEEGLKVVVCGRNQEKNNYVRRHHKSVTVIDCDITDESEVYLLHQLISSIGGIDILYNNAAVINAYDLVACNEDVFLYAEQEINANYLAVIRLNSFFMEMLKQRPEAAIIHTTSAVAYSPIYFISTYSSSKAALHSYVKSLRSQLKRAGTSIKVFELIPPTVDTAVTKSFKGRKVSASIVIQALVKGLKNDTFTIRVSVVKILYLINRFFPSIAERMLNK